MKSKTYPLAMPSWTQEEIDAATEVISSKKTTMGKRVKSFETNFSSFVGVKNTLMVNSGSSANLLMAATLREYLRINNDGRNTVIAPALGWSTSYAPFVQLGFNVKVCDVELSTYNISMQPLLKCIENDVVAILAINILGNPCNLLAIEDLCRSRNVYMLEDNCESLGARTQDKRCCGSVGIMSTHSFFFSHHINTMEGGALSTSNNDLFILSLIIRNHGWIRDIENYRYLLDGDSKVIKHINERAKLNEKAIPSFYSSFHFLMPGFNLRPTEIQGAIGTIQLRKLPEYIQSRRRNLEYLVSKLSELDIPIQIQKENGVTSSFGFGFICETENTRNSLVDYLKEKEIECRPIVCGNIANHPLSEYLDTNNCLENAQSIHKRGFFIGNHHIDISDMIDNFIAVIASFYSETSNIDSNSSREIT